MDRNSETLEPNCFLRKFWKLLAYNVLRLALSGVEPTPSHYKYNKTLGEKRKFDWGEIFSEHDSKGGGTNITINYLI